MQGEFSIVKGYGGEISNLFSVTNPHKPKGQDHFVYTITVRYLLNFNLNRAKIKKVPSKFSEDTKNSIYSAQSLLFVSLVCMYHQFLRSRPWIIRIASASKRDVTCWTFSLSSWCVVPTSTSLKSLSSSFDLISSSKRLSHSCQNWMDSNYWSAYPNTTLSWEKSPNPSCKSRWIKSSTL